MEIHNVFAHDIEGDDLASRMSIAIKKEQIISKQGDFEFQEEVKRRQSVVNLKEFVKDLKENSSQVITPITQDTDTNPPVQNDKTEPKEGPKEIGIPEDSKEEQPSSEDKTQKENIGEQIHKMTGLSLLFHQN